MVAGHLLDDSYFLVILYSAVKKPFAQPLGLDLAEIGPYGGVWYFIFSLDPGYGDE